MLIELFVYIQVGTFKELPHYGSTNSPVCVYLPHPKQVSRLRTYGIDRFKVYNEQSTRPYLSINELSEELFYDAMNNTNETDHNRSIAPNDWYSKNV